jgi:hypothetical protein
MSALWLLLPAVTTPSVAPLLGAASTRPDRLPVWRKAVPTAAWAAGRALLLAPLRLPPVICSSTTSLLKVRRSKASGAYAAAASILQG